MPVTSYTASGDNRYDDLTDLEKVAEQNRVRVEENLLRMHLQDKAAGEAERIAAMQEAGQTGRLGMSLEGQRGLQSDLLAGQERMGGTFADKTSAAEKLQRLAQGGELERTKLTMGPQQTYADIAKSGWEAGAHERALAQKVAGFKGGILDQAFSGGGGISLTPEDKRSFAYGAMGMTRPQSEDEYMREVLKQIVATKAVSGDLGDLQDAMTALKTKDLSKMSSTPQALMAKTNKQLQVFEAPDVKGKLDMAIQKGKTMTANRGLLRYVSDDEVATIGQLVKDAIDTATRYGVDPNLAAQTVKQRFDAEIPAESAGIFSNILNTILGNKYGNIPTAVRAQAGLQD